MKNTKKLLAILLSLVMLLGIMPISVFAETPEPSNNAGDIIEFGSYPQSRVTDTATLTALNGKTLSWVSYGYYSGEGYFGTMVQGDWMKFADVTLDGNKYRAVSFSQYRPYRTVYTSSADNSYQDDNGYELNTVYWFKYEPIKWRILDPSTGLVLSETCIDAQAYSNVIYNPKLDASGSGYVFDFERNYDEISLRKWLNDDFYNTAFTVDQQSEIINTTLESTADKVFLLSYDEAKNSSYGFSDGSDRIALSTDYANSQGCWQSTSSDYEGNASWVLRTPSSVYHNRILCVGADGIISDGDTCYVHNTSFGVRPALRFMLSTTVYISDVTAPVRGTTASWNCSIPANREYVKALNAYGYHGAWIETDTRPQTWADAFYSGTSRQEQNGSFTFNPDKFYTFMAMIKPVAGDDDLSGFTSANLNGNTAGFENKGTYGYVWYCFGKPAPKTLSSISVTTPPTKTTYNAGENFDPAGMVVQANYSDGTSATITDYTLYNGTDLSPRQGYVVISYTEDDVTKTTTVAVTVNAPTKPLSSISVTTPPTKTTYTAGENFDPAGMVVKANYSDSTSATITGYTVTNGANLTAGQTSVTISYTEDGVTKTTTVAVTVNAPAEKIKHIEVSGTQVPFIGESVDWTMPTVPGEAGYELISSYEWLEHDETFEDLDAFVDIGNFDSYSNANEDELTFKEGYYYTLVVYAYPESGFEFASVDEMSGEIDETEADLSDFALGEGVMAIYRTYGPLEKVTLTGIEIKSAPYQTEYQYKDKAGVSRDGLKVVAHYSNGTEKDVTENIDIQNYFIEARRGENTATVEYQGKTATFNYTIKFAWWQWLIKILLFGFIWY